MALTRFNPILMDWNTTRDRLNKIFGKDDFWDGEGNVTLAEWTPSVDIVEKEKEFCIKADLPGVDAKDVSVTMDNNVLTLAGERRLDKEVKKEHYHRVERSHGSFSRTFSVPNSVDADNIRAEFKDGLLTLTLPKKAPSNGIRNVEVKAA